MKKSLEAQPAGILHCGFKLLPELDLESGTAYGCFMPTEGSQRLSGEPDPVSLPPEPENEFIIPGGLHILPQAASLFKGTAAEKQCRLGDIIDALIGEPRRDREKKLLEAGYRPADFPPGRIDNRAGTKTERCLRIFFKTLPDPLQAAGKIIIICVDPGQDVPRGQPQPLVNGIGGPRVRFDHQPVNVVFMPGKYLPGIVGAAAVYDNIFDINAFAALENNTGNGLREKGLSVVVYCYY